MYRSRLRVRTNTKNKKPSVVDRSKRAIGTQPESEDDLQRLIVSKFRAHGAIVVLTDAVGPALKYIGDQTRRMGFISWSKARGWSKGIPDCVILWKKHALFLELKTPTGKGRLSDEQKLWRDKVIEAGYEYACWNSLDECSTWIANVLKEESGDK